MICYRCGNMYTLEEFCPVCGENLHLFQKAHRMSNSYYNDGLKKAQIRNLSGAIESLRKSLKFNKFNTDARNLLGLVCYEMGDTVEALSEWVISKNYQPENNKAVAYLDELRKTPNLLDRHNQMIKKYNQAIVYCKSNSRDLAIIQLKKVLSVNPKMVRAHQLLGLLYYEEGRYEQARKTLRLAAKIDVNNTITQRYLLEINQALKEQQSKKKKHDPEEDLISYQSGNETIIMPKRFKESSLGATLLYILIGLLVGVAATSWLIVPNVRNTSVSQARKQLVEANDTITSYRQTIATLQETVDSMKEELETATDASTQIKGSVATYETLLNAYASYMENDIVKAGNYLSELDEAKLSGEVKRMMKILRDVVDVQYLEELYQQGYAAYRNREYETACDLLQMIVDKDITYENGGAVYYLAQSYRKNDNLAAAKPYYQYVVENYPNTDRAKTAKVYANKEIE